MVVESKNIFKSMVLNTMVMNLLDGVKTADIRVTKEVKSLSENVKDRSLSMVDRIECFEDSISIEIGVTSLNRARNPERVLNVRQLYIKYEGENPSGTQKDRIAFAQVHDAFRREYDVISLATIGNYGAHGPSGISRWAGMQNLYSRELPHRENQGDGTFEYPDSLPSRFIRGYRD